MDEHPDPRWDDEVLVPVVASVMRSSALDLEAVRAAGRAVFTWLRVDEELDDLLGGSQPSWSAARGAVD